MNEIQDSLKQLLSDIDDVQIEIEDSDALDEDLRQDLLEAVEDARSYICDAREMLR